MARAASAPLKLLRSSDESARDDGGQVVVALHGEHDSATVVEVTHLLAQALAAGDGDLVVDLADVEFMGAATVSVIARAGAELQRQSRTLFLRSPNSSAQRVLKVCGFSKLFDWAPEVTHVGPGTGALATWVAVPPADREGSVRSVPPLVSLEPA